MKSYQFQVKEGIAPNEAILNFIRSCLPNLKDGFWEVRFQKPKRTDLENRTFHGWCRIISQETGESQQFIYQYLCQMFNPLKCTYRQDGSFASGGTSELNTKDFATFLTEIKAHVASELGINLPTKDEESFKEFYSQYCN